MARQTCPFGKLRAGFEPAEGLTTNGGNPFHSLSLSKDERALFAYAFRNRS
jgi:hypothetical protein